MGDASGSHTATLDIQGKPSRSIATQLCGTEILFEDASGPLPLLLPEGVCLAKGAIKNVNESLSSMGQRPPFQ